MTFIKKISIIFIKILFKPHRIVVRCDIHYHDMYCANHYLIITLTSFEIRDSRQRVTLKSIKMYLFSGEFLILSPRNDQ